MHTNPSKRIRQALMPSTTCQPFLTALRLFALIDTCTEPPGDSRGTVGSVNKDVIWLRPVEGVAGEIVLAKEPRTEGSCELLDNRGEKGEAVMETTSWFAGGIPLSVLLGSLFVLVLVVIVGITFLLKPPKGK